jgi:transcriptional regulator with GAF, ATPase, and Fis domain
MTPMTTEQAFAEAMAALVDDHDVADVLAHLLRNCALLYPASAVAVLVRDRGGNLELLSATSHRATELELLQIQSERGPCLDALTSDEVVTVSGESAMVERWGAVGEQIAAAGYSAVHAYPMHWRGRCLGGLNVFLTEESTAPEDARRLGQLFADVATIVVVQSTDVPADQVTARVHEAVTSRAVVEQAKGVIAYRRRSDMAEAYDQLLELSRERGATITETARQVVAEAHQHSPDLLG